LRLVMVATEASGLRLSAAAFTFEAAFRLSRMDIRHVHSLL